MGVLAVGSSFCPTLTADSFGVLAVDCAGFASAIDQASLGNGKTYLGSITTGTNTAGALGACSDHVYRLGGGGGALTIPNGVLVAGNSLQVGAPCAAVAGLSASAANGSGTVILKAANTYSGNVVYANCLLEGTAQTNGSPFGDGNAPVTLYGGSLQLDGISTTATVSVGPVTLNGGGSFLVNQASTATNTLAIADLGLASRNAAAPWVAQFKGVQAGGLGGKQRIVVNANPPLVTNAMVAPYLVSASGDFLSYVAGAGFTNAAFAYSNVTASSPLSSLPGTSIANVAVGATNSADASVYALRLGTTITNSGTANTITVGSGGIVAFHNSGTVLIYDNVAFGNAEGIMYVPIAGTVLNLPGVVSGSNGVTIAGPGTVGLRGNNAITGTIAIAGGKLAITNDNALGVTPNPICLSGGGMLQFVFSGADSHPINVGPSGGTLDNGNTVFYTMTLGGPITGTGMLTYRESAYTWTLAITNQNNTYSGGSLLLGNALIPTIASNSTLGIGDVTAAGAQVYFLGDHNVGGGDTNGNQTVSRQARLSVEPASSVYFLSANPSVGSLSGSGNLYLTNTLLTLGGDNSSTLFDGTLNQCAASTGRLCKVGSGTFTFKGLLLLPGATLVNGGTFVADGFMTGGIIVNSGATLAGAGSVGAVTLQPGANLLPGSTVTNGVPTNTMTALTASSLTFSAGAKVTININGPTNYTQLVVNGPVNLGGATLQVNLNYPPQPTDEFYVVLNSSGNATTPGFAGLAENGTIDLGRGYRGRISYVGTGDATGGNDVKIYHVVRGGSVMLVR